MSGYKCVVGLVLCLCCLLSSACLEAERIVYQFDLRTKKGKITFVAIGSDRKPTGKRSGEQQEQEDYRVLMHFSAAKKIRVGRTRKLGLIKHSGLSKRLYEHRGKLNGELVFRFDKASDIELGSYDSKRPYRFCPPEGTVVAASNGHFRDSTGCVIWERSAQLLRIEVVPWRRAKGNSLLARYKSGRAGRP